MKLMMQWRGSAGGRSGLLVGPCFSAGSRHGKGCDGDPSLLRLRVRRRGVFWASQAILEG